MTNKAFLFLLIAAGLLAGCAASRSSGISSVPPLYYSNPSQERRWYAAGLVGSWRNDDWKLSRWVLPLFVETPDALYTIPYSKVDHGSQKEHYYFCGLAGAVSLTGHSDSSWLLPLYHVDENGWRTVLCGNTKEADWFLPLYVRSGADFHTLLYSIRDDRRTGARGFVSPPLLTIAYGNTNSSEQAFFTLGGLVGSKTNASGDRHQAWTLPFYYRDEGRSFLSLAYGWDGGRTYKTNTWYAAGLVGKRSGSVEGEWAFPFYSRSKDVDFDVRAAEFKSGAMSVAKDFVVRSRRSYLWLLDSEEYVRGARAEDGLTVVRGGSWGNDCLYRRSWREERSYDTVTHACERRTRATGSLFWGLIEWREDEP